MAQLNSRGFTVVSAGYGTAELKRLARSMKKEVLDILFGEERTGLLRDPTFDFSPENPEVWKLFTNPRLREKILLDPTSIWAEGNSRRPKLSKSCGQAEIHFSPLIHKKVLFDPRPYQILSQAYEKKELVHSSGPEKICLKPPGATEMPIHCDRNLWCEANNYSERIQAFLAVEVPSTGLWDQRGGLEVLANFHHYWDLASALFHPETGLVPFPAGNSRFHVYPKDFNRTYLPLLQKVARFFTRWFHHDEDPETVGYISGEELLDFFNRIEFSDPPEEYQPIEWEVIQYHPGDLVLWSQNLPHRSLANKTDEMRAVIYYSVFPVTPEFDESEQRVWVREMFHQAKFFYTVEANQYSRQTRNVPEYLYRQAHGVPEYYLKTKLSRRLSGERSWFS